MKKEDLKELNSITHPLIINEIKNQIKKIKQKCGNKTKIVIDAPLLLETKTENLVDNVVVVRCDKKNILKRNKKYPREKIERILIELRSNINDILLLFSISEKKFEDSDLKDKIQEN